MTNLQSLKRVLIMAGGTGGHVFPGLALAAYLKKQGVEVEWLGTDNGLESRLVPEHGLKMHSVTIGGVRGKGLKTLLAAPLKVITAIRESLKAIRTFKPDVIVGMGGFVSGPGGMAAWLSGTPLVIHEQNAKAGLTNKILAVFAKRVLVGFPAAFPEAKKVVVTGNPVRAEIEAFPKPETRLIPDRGQFRLLVLGGSLGAKALNDMMPKAMALLSDADKPLVWHQAGEKHVDDAKKAYESMGMTAKVVPFINNMAEAYSWADMVLCRAGALTIAELCAAGAGAVLVPYPHAVDDHQTANANYMVQGGAALCVQQVDLTAERLADIIKQFAGVPAKRLEMAQAAYALRHTNVTENIAAILGQLTNRTN